MTLKFLQLIIMQISAKDIADLTLPPFGGEMDAVH